MQSRTASAAAASPGGAASPQTDDLTTLSPAALDRRARDLRVWTREALRRYADRRVREEFNSGHAPDRVLRAILSLASYRGAFVLIPTRDSRGPGAPNRLGLILLGNYERLIGEFTRRHRRLPSGFRSIPVQEAAKLGRTGTQRGREGAPRADPPWTSDLLEAYYRAVNDRVWFVRERNPQARPRDIHSVDSSVQALLVDRSFLYSVREATDFAVSLRSARRGGQAEAALLGIPWPSPTHLPGEASRRDEVIAAVLAWPGLNMSAGNPTGTILDMAVRIEVNRLLSRA